MKLLEIADAALWIGKEMMETGGDTLFYRGLWLCRCRGIGSAKVDTCDHCRFN